MTPLILAAAAIAIAAVLYLYRRARRLAADPCRVSAELDAANAAIAGNHWTWERRANAALHELDLAIEDRNDEARLRVELVRAMAEASDVLEDERDEARSERDALVVRRDALLDLVAKLTRETPYPAELDECRAARAKLIAEVGTLRAERVERERIFADRVAGLEAAIAQVVGDRDAHAARCVELAQRVSKLEKHETSASIAAWADATFGVPETNMSVWERANKEFQELHKKLEADDGHPGAAEECADVRIVLDRMVHRLGSDMQREADRKMAVNRARPWQLTGDGHGQHVDGGAP